MKVMNNFFLLCQEASFGAVSGVVSALNILEIINVKKDGSNRKISFIALTKNTVDIEEDDKEDLGFSFAIRVENKTTGKIEGMLGKDGGELRIISKFNKKDIDDSDLTKLSIGTVTPIEYEFKEEGVYEFSIFDDNDIKLSSYTIFVKKEK